MKNEDFTVSFEVAQTPGDVFKAVTDVRGWWSEEITGGTEKLNDAFHYHYRDVHSCKMKLTEVIPGKKVVWEVLENHFNFTQDESEWLGNTIRFDISEQDGKTRLHFTHVGLVPAYECYSICFDAWTGYITKSLRDLIVTGKGQPNPKE